ncbi:hypothetical protein QBC38DRAFT_464818 [Podospora fimiseda]|uniref:Hemerythrin-like domain-containing protein n=1 Tax=Podospora fimiseda TaxID=252190 RepID=A0AAN7BYL7_9PEZI|nr:hypothetical protein QBC38DRAFT_464818 [Podospora fimiseda]
MAPIYADHPFPLITTPVFTALSKDPNAKPDSFDYNASEMAGIHNVILQGLNSIYLQASHIPPTEQKSFCKYILTFYQMLHVHHTGEEELFFPAVEKMSGVKGVMDGNIEQHRVFGAGLDNLKQYAEAVIADKEVYEGGKIVEIIDGFGQSLAKHLADEIPTLQGLRVYGEKMNGLTKALEEEAEHSMKIVGFEAMVWLMANMDVHRENDIWIKWPAAPVVLKVLLRTVFWWYYPDARKFGSTDRMGNMQPLKHARTESGGKKSV